MENQGETTRVGGLVIVLLIYACATLLHFSHNAVFLHEYPGMPAWLTPAGVCAAWLGLTAIGLAGYLLVRWSYRFAGLVVIAAYGALGFDSLAHYSLAPMSAHTLTMNLTIWLDAATAALVLAAVARLMAQQLRERRI
ncbi:MAG: hypothetical protein ACREF4_09685 [Gammaproteobacteria bacterium]